MRKIIVAASAGVAALSLAIAGCSSATTDDDVVRSSGAEPNTAPPSASTVAPDGVTANAPSYDVDSGGSVSIVYSKKLVKDQQFQIEGGWIRGDSGTLVLTNSQGGPRTFPLRDVSVWPNEAIKIRLYARDLLLGETPEKHQPMLLRQEASGYWSGSATIPQVRLLGVAYVDITVTIKDMHIIQK
ncbi:MAG: hypothetical protein U0990_07540 [Candidatus Nanopelagicales bacterium]|nr:hypothetical protein [Candidatus Nanopelagicales bacterium]MDZ4249927.1 hypothetical protein [Candidatus Nanopelagicales bacterium]